MKERVHELKTLPPYFEAAQRGEKTFEVRRDDRGFQRGDRVDLIKYGPCKPTGGDGYMNEYDDWCAREEGLRLSFRIGWILTGGQFGIEPGYVVFSLEPLPQPPGGENDKR